MHRKVSPCGRHPPRPEQKDLEQIELKEEAMPIHQQIENLRTKIALKERYNNVLKDELEESREGASSILKDLHDETLGLRQALIDAIGKEKFAVQNAMRTHRLFQLSLRSKTPQFAIAFLDDKLFDLAKQLNLLVDQLLNKRIKLREAEKLVYSIEKWPRPGSLPWEADVARKIQQVGIATSNMGVKLETARILNIKYQEIKEKLRREEELYAPIIRNLDAQLKHQTEEYNTLQKMLDDAEIFQVDAVSNLASTEHEASANRKIRRIQMARIKKAVEKVLEENTKNENPQTTTEVHQQGPVVTSTRAQRPARIISSRSVDQQASHHAKLTERLKLKKAEIEKLQSWVSRLVETMRVPDITYVPTRLSTGIVLSSQLTSEREFRGELRDVLVHQRDQLLLILHHIRYTGSAEESEFQKVLSDYDKTLAKSEAEVELARTLLKRLGDITSSIRVGMISIHTQLDKPDVRQKMKSSNQLIRQLPVVHEQIESLVSSIANLKSQFNSPSGRDYSVGVKAPPVPEKWVRVGTPHVSDASDEEDYDDYKVPTRAEILANSQKVILQGKLRRGINGLS